MERKNIGSFEGFLRVENEILEIQLLKMIEIWIKK